MHLKPGAPDARAVRDGVTTKERTTSALTDFCDQDDPRPEVMLNSFVSASSSL